MNIGGRPKVNAKDKRVKTLQVVLKQKEYEMIKEVAKEYKCSLSTAGRGMIIEWIEAQQAHNKLQQEYDKLN